MKRLGLVFGVLCAVVLLAGCGKAVPSLNGMDPAQAEAALTVAGFTKGQATEAFDASVPAGRIVGQTPAAGQSAKPGSAVAFVVSKGPEPVAVPVVKGGTEGDARAALEGAGFAVTVKKQDDKAPEGTVLGIEPKDATALPGTTFTITVSTGLDLVKVPSWKEFKSTYQGDDFGLAMDSYQAALEAGFKKAGLKAVVEFTPYYDRPVKQYPKPGAMVPRGTVVKLEIGVAD